MASNKTKLADANTKSAFDFDDDFESYFNDDFSTSSNKKKPLQEFMAGFKDGMLDKNKNKSLLKAFLVNGAPKGYDRLFGVYDDLKRGATDLKDHLEKTNPGDLQYLFKRAESFLPSLKGKVSDSSYDRINTALSNKVDQYKYQIEANQDQRRVAIRRQQADDQKNLQEMMGDDLRSAVDQGTVVQRSLFNKGQEADQRRWDLDRIERGLRDSAQDKHNQYMARGLAQAVDGITRMASYTEQVQYDFQRKGLELQFRSYIALRDMSKMAEATMDMQNKAFQALVRNTGLPDHLKSSMKDLMSMNMRQGMAGAATGAIGRTLSGFLGGYGGNVQNRVNQRASSTLSGIVQGLQTGESFSDFWDQRYNLAGGLAADGVHGFARNYAAPVLGRMARPMMTRLSNKHGKGRHNQVGYAADNMPAMMQEFVNNYQNSYGAKGVLQDMLRPFVPQFGLDTSTKSGSYQTIGQHTAFNQLSQRSLTEIIPGFQARILRELQRIRTGNEDVALTSFDITKGVFTTDKSAKEALQDRIVSKGTTRMVSAQISEALDKFDPESKLSKGARRALGERLMRDANTNKRFDPMRYGSKHGYKDGTSKETLAELEGFFKEQFERDDKGKFAETAANFAKRKDYSDAFLNIRNVSRDPAQEIHRLIESGNTGMLREMGILETVEGQDRINYPMLWSMMSSGVSDTNGGGFRYQESSGDTTDRNFVGPQFPGRGSAKFQNAAIKALEGPKAQAMKDAAKRGLGNARDVMDQFKADPGQFMRDQYNAGAQAARNKGSQLKDSAQAAMDAAKGGGLPAVMQHFSAQEKLDMAKALLNNTIEKEPPAMREARLKMAQALIASIDTVKEAGSNLMASENGQKAIAAGNQALALGHDAAEQIRQSETAGIVDLKLKEGQDVLVRAQDMIAGKLIDVNTGKVIQKASDITGEVRNHLNQQVLSAAEAAQGLYSQRGTLMAKAKEKFDTIQNVIKSTATNLAGQARDKLDDMKDWCLEGKDEIVIKSRDLLDGKYFDASTLEPIFSLDDIKGTLLDAQGRVVATGEELARGLRSIDGKKFDVPGMKEKASALAQRMWRQSATTNVLMMAKNAGSFAWKLARNTFARITGDRDAYLPPDIKPVLTVEKLKEGKYLDIDGKPYNSMSDINGAVIDADSGEPLLDKNELKNLVDVNGKKHKIAKNRGILRRIVKGAVGGYWKMTKAYYGKLAGEMGNDIKAGARTLLAPVGEFSKRQLASLSTTDQVLVQIRDAIRETVPKKNRKGSWMEKDEKKAAEEQKDGKESKEETERKGLFGRLTAGLGGLWDKMRGKKKDEGEEEEDEGGGLLDTAQDALGTAADVKDLAGGRGGRRARGRLGRLGGRIAGSRLGQFAATQGGRLMATAGGQLAMRGAAMAGTAIAGLFSAPVLIGAAVVAGVGIAGYMGYKYYKSVNGDLGNLRYLQYGVNGLRKRRKILALEQLLEKSAVRGQNAQLNLNAESGKQIMDIMGFSKDDEAEIHRFARWVDLRFKPVFIQWLRALDTVGQTQMSLAEIDDKMDDKLKGTFLKELDVPSEVYDMRDNPFGDKEPLDDTAAEAKETMEKLKEKYKVDPDAEKKAELPGKQPEAPADPNNVKRADTVAQAAAGTVVGATAVAAAKKAADEAKAIGQKGLDEKNKVARDLTTKVQGIAKAAAMGQTAQFANFVANPVMLPNTALPALDSIRMRAYGLETLDQAFVEALMTMEKSVHRQAKADQSGMIRFGGNMEYFVAACGSLLGMKTSENGPERVKFVNWLNNRFMPVCEAFLTSIRVNFRGQPDQASTQIGLGDQVRVANAVIGAQSPDSTAVWSTPSIFMIMGDLQDLKRLADIDLEDLKKKAAAVLASPTQTAGAQEAGKNAAAGGKSFLDGVGDTLSKAGSAVAGAASSAASSVGSALSGAASTVKGWFGGDNASSGAGASTGKDVAAVEGQQYGYVQPGNGGSWEQIPMPTSKDAKGSRKTMEVVAQMVGVPVQYLMIFCAMESGFDWTIKAGAGGSATGWFQFINSTWDWMISQHSQKYGIPADSGRRLRLDPRINALMGAEYMKYSMGVIKKQTGKDPTDIDIYLAHFLGPGTAVKWIKLPKNTIGSSAFPKEARANPSIFTDKATGTQRTLGQIEQSFDKRMEKFRAMANAGTAGGPAVPLTIDEVEKQQADEKAKASEAEAKKDDKFIPGVSAMPGGPSVTGSTPTNAGTGGATMPAATGGGATTAPAGASNTPVGPMPPSQSTTASPDAGADQSGGNAYQAAKAAADAAAAKDADRARQVQTDTKAGESMMSIARETLQVNRDQLAALQDLVKAAGGGQGNSMPKSSAGRGANSSPYPVNV